MVQAIIVKRLDQVSNKDRRFPKLLKDDILEVAKYYINKSSQELRMKPEEVIEMINKNFDEEYYLFQQVFFELGEVYREEVRVKEKHEIPQYEKEYLYKISDVAEISGMYREEPYTTQVIRLHNRAGEIKIYDLKGMSKFVTESDLLNYIYNKFKKKVAESDLVNIRRHHYKTPKYKGD